MTLCSWALHWWSGLADNPLSLQLESAMHTPMLRIARPTDDINALLPFYRDGLGLSVLGHFEDHAGFDGVMLGRPGGPYQL